MPHRVEKRAMVFFVFPLLFIISPLFFSIKTTKTTFFIKRSFLSKGPFFLIRRPLFFDRQILPFFSSKFSPFSHHGECGPHLFFQRRYRPTSYQMARDLRKKTQTNLFLSFFRQTGTGPRHTHCGAQGKSELCVQRADSTSHRLSLSLRRERDSS